MSSKQAEAPPREQAETPPEKLKVSVCSSDDESSDDESSDDDSSSNEETNSERNSSSESSSDSSCENVTSESEEENHEIIIPRAITTVAANEDVSCKPWLSIPTL